MDNSNVHRWIYRLGSGGVEKRPSFVQMFHHAPPLMMKPHWHAQSEVNFIVRGSVRYSMHTHELNLHAGALVFFWGGLPHQLIDASEDAVYAGGHLPPIHFFRLKLPEEALHQLMHGATLLTTATDPTDQINFLRWAEYVQSGDPARANHAVTELLLRLERMRFDRYEIVGGGQPQEVQPVSERLQAFRNVGLMCGFIADNFLDEIDTASIASSVGLHPKYAMRLFKKSTGMAIMEYVSLLRLSYAQALLLREDANILDVAMESGFRSISGFNKSFRKMAGMSPSDFRREELARD